MVPEVMDLPIDSAADLERWLVAVGELNSAVGEEGVERHVAMTCQTDDPEREAAYLAFVRDIEPKLKPIQNAIRARYLDAPVRSELPRDRYFVFDRALENRRSLFREANIPRETQLAELEQQYQKTIGAMTVTFRGQERTLAQMAPFLEETDRSVREEAWTLAASRRLQDRETLDDLFDQMKQLRIEIAHEAGFANFVDYAFRSRERFDYGIADSIRFHESVEKVVVPLDAADPGKAQAGAGRGNASGPGTLAVDPLGRPPLVPFKDVEQLAAGTETIFRDVEPRAGRPVRLPPRAQSARSGQPQGQGPRRLSDDLRRQAAAVHFHERGRTRFRRPDLAPRRRACLPHAGLPRRAAVGLPREPDRVLRGRLDDHGASGRTPA